MAPAKSIHSIISAAESSLSAAETERRAQRDALIITIPKLEENAAEANRLPHVIRASWAKAEATYSGADLANAEAEAERTAKILAGTKANISRLDRKLSANDSAVADALVPVIAKALIGVTVVATKAPESYWGDVPRSLYPTCVLIQESDTVHNPSSGAMSAKVSVRFLRTSSHRELSQRALESALASVQGSVRVAFVNQGHGGDYATDKAQVVVDSIWGDGAPVIAEIDSSAPDRVGSSLGTIAVALGQANGGRSAYGNRLDRDASNGAWIQRAYGAHCTGLKPMVSQTVNGGERKTVVSGTVNVNLSGVAGKGVSNIFGNPDIYESLNAAYADEAGQLVGLVHPGLGRCESFRIIAGTSEKVGPFRPYHFDATYVSRVA